MTDIINELIKKLRKNEYPMGTGSDDWWDLKTEFELKCDTLVSVVSNCDSGKHIDKEKIYSYRRDLDEFKIRVDSYSTKDDVESKEKALLSDQIKMCLEIYKHLL